MLGAIIGDIVGSPYEFTENNIKTTDFPLFSNKSYFTDDTVMTIAVALGIMKGYNNKKATKEAIIDSMHAFGDFFPYVGYGGRFGMWLHDKIRTPYKSYGNGSAMRVSSVAWAYDTLKEVETYAKISAEVTHNHKEGIKGACATAAAIFMARNKASKEEIKQYLTKKYKYDLNRQLDDVRQVYTYFESCQETVPEALIAFLESENFEDAIRKAVSIGGDSDTLAAITGSIAEGYYQPLPDDIVQGAILRLDIRLIEALNSWQSWLENRA